VSLRAILANCTVCALLASAAPAMATSTGEQQQSPLQDQGSSPNYRSTITSVSPSQPGLSVQVLQFSDRLLLRNATGRTVSIPGYEGEPYARIDADGAVEVNTRSPAYYLNQSFYGNVTVPALASAKAPPRWRLVDRTGRFEWHDHRIHWMSPTLPPQVKDKGRRTLIFDWRVPIAVGAAKGGVSGRLYWTPNSSSAPVAAIVIGGAIVVLGLLLVIATRRRRGLAPPAPAGADSGPRNRASAASTGGEEPGHREAW
jgi:hypothetical protein